MAKDNLLIIPNTLATFGGGEHLAFGLYHRLGYAYNVRIVNPFSNKDLIRTEKADLLKQHKIKPEDVVDVRCRSFRMRTYGNEEFLFMIPTSEGKRSLESAVRWSGSVYGITQNPLLLSAAVRYANRFNSKYVFAIQNYLFSSFFDSSTGIVSNAQKWAYRSILKRIRHFHALNSYDAGLVRRNIPDARPYIIPGFTDSSPTRITANRKEFVVLWVGRLDRYQKGVDLFCDIVERAVAKESGIRFLVLGGGEDGEPLIKDLASRYRRNVEWKGFVPHEEVKKAYRQSSLIAFTSRGDELRYFPLVFLEGQSFGLPIVAFDGKGCKGIVGDKVNGTLVRPFDTSGFADEIISRYRKWKDSSISYSKIMSTVSRHATERFGPDVVIPKMAKMLKPFS